MINDDRGMRTGTAYIRFVRALNVPKALVRDGTMFKNSKIALEAVSDEDFKNAVDSYKPSRNRFNHNDNRGSNNDNSSRHMESRWDDRDRDRGDSTPRDERSRFNDKPFSVLLVKDVPSHATQLDVMKLFSSYTILDILMTHRPGNRRDTIAYIKFLRAEEAQSAYEEQTKHRINQRQVRIAIASDSDYEQAKEQMRLENEEQIRLQKELEERENRRDAETETNAKTPMVDSDDRNDCEQENDQDQDDEQNHEDDRDSQSFNIDEENNFNNEPDNIDQNSSNSKSSSRLNGIPSLLDIPATLDNAGDKVPDPRLRQGRPSRFDNPHSNNMNNMNNLNNMNNSNNNQMTPAHDNFILIKNCEYRLSIQTVGEFFVAHNLMPNHVEMLRNNRNQPRGEFIIELQNGKDAEKALRLNNVRLNSRPLRVCPISPQQIADILNKPFMNFFPGGGANNNNMMMARMMMMQNQRSNFNNLGGGGGNYNNNNGNNRGYGNDRNMLDDDDQMQFGGPRGGNGGDGNGPMNNRKMNPFNNNPSNSNMYDDSNRQQQQSPQQQNQQPPQQLQQHSEIIDLDNESVEGDDGNNDGDIDGGAEEEDIADCDDGNADIDADADAEGDIDADAIDGDGIPEKFTLPGCVVEMENVPYRCGLKDIMDFFDGFNVQAEDIIRRYNDDGSPTGDARVAFSTPEDAKLAYEQKRQKSIMNRTIFLNVL